MDDYITNKSENRAMKVGILSMQESKIMARFASYKKETLNDLGHEVFIDIKPRQLLAVVMFLMKKRK